MNERGFVDNIHGLVDDECPERTVHHEYNTRIYIEVMYVGQYFLEIIHTTRNEKFGKNDIKCNVLWLDPNKRINKDQF